MRLTRFTRINHEPKVGHPWLNNNNKFDFNQIVNVIKNIYIIYIYNNTINIIFPGN